MSGGSLDYVSFKLGDAIEILKKDPLSYRRAFGAHLEKVSKALYDIEWVLSGDYGEGDDEKAVLACITNQDILRILILEATNIRDELSNILRKIKGKV